MPQISDTIASAGGHLARPTRFSLYISPPSPITSALGGPGNTSTTFDVLVKTIKVPDVNLQTIDISYKGHKIGMPGRTNQEQTIEVTMYLDEDHRLRQIFHDWISGMDQRYYAVSSGGAQNIANSRNWYGTLKISQIDFDESPTPVKNYYLDKVFPIAVGGSTFDGSGTGQVSEFSVTFQYWRFLTDTPTGQFDNVNDNVEEEQFGQLPRDSGNVSALGSVSQLAKNIGDSRQIISDFDSDNLIRGGRL